MPEKTKIHSTNYFDTFIEVAEDTKTDSGTIPPAKDKKTVAEMQHDMISKNPYKYTSDDIFFQVFADRNDLTKAEYKQENNFSQKFTIDKLRFSFPCSIFLTTVSVTPALSANSSWGKPSCFLLATIYPYRQDFGFRYK